MSADPYSPPTTAPPPPADGNGSGSVPPSARAPRGRRWVPIAAAVVVVAVVLASLVATGLIPLGRPASAGPAFSPTFQGAASEGQGPANDLAGGPWNAAAGVAIRIPLSITIPATNLTQALASFEAASGCVVTESAAAPTNVVLSGTPSAAGPGASSFWLVLYVNGTGGAVGVMVNGGVSSELFSLGGNATCTGTLRYLVPFPSASPDSSNIAAAVNAVGGSAFLAAHPNATQVFLGFSVVLLLPGWEVVYTTCSPTFAVNATGAQFNASVSGTTVQSHSNGTVSCSLPGNLTGLPGGLRPGAPPRGPVAGEAAPAIGKAI